MTKVSPGVGEAARSMLAVIDASNGPDVQGLAGRLSVVDEEALGRQMDAAIAEGNTRANRQLVLGAVALLPRWMDGGYRGRFVGAESLLAAKVAGAEILWHSRGEMDRPRTFERDAILATDVLGPLRFIPHPQRRLPRTSKGDFVPYVPIGSRDSSRSLKNRAFLSIPTTELLLHPLSGGGDGLKIINVPNEELVEALNLGLERLDADWTADDVEEMRDRGTGAYRLTPGRGTDTTAFRTTPRSEFFRYIGDTRDGVQRKGIHAEVFRGPNYMTDAVMEEFGVYGRLGGLATAFDKTAEMDELFAEYDQQRATPGEGIVFFTPGK